MTYDELTDKQQKLLEIIGDDETLLDCAISLVLRMKNVKPLIFKVKEAISDTV